MNSILFERFEEGSVTVLELWRKYQKWLPIVAVRVTGSQGWGRWRGTITFHAVCECLIVKYNSCTTQSRIRTLLASQKPLVISSNLPPQR
jgi:hypothetical protein